MSEADSTQDASSARLISHERLRSALEEANFPTLLMVLVHLTGDNRWLAERYRPRRGKPMDDNDSAGLPEDVQMEIRQAAFDAIVAYWAGNLTPSTLSHDDIARMLEIAMVEEVPREYGPILAEEMSLETRDGELPRPPRDRGFRVVVIGAGISGLCAAKKLQDAGIDYTVVEKDPDVGGTWLENSYPGCGVDTPSHLYSFSFAPNTQWSRYFAKRDQVQHYLERITDDFELRRNIRFDTEVLRADYDEPTATWNVQVLSNDGSRQTLTCNVLLSAVGMVNRPLIPPIPGLEHFPGPVMHSAEWRHDVPLKGKRVAVVGTGASAMQIVPSIADTADRVLVFQRSKQWALPHPNIRREVTDNVRFLLEEVPF